MQTDRELLELAAKAAGVQGHYRDVYGPDVGQDASGITKMTQPRWGHPLWNPLTDDGDALRLAVKLDMQIWRSAAGGVAAVSPSSDFWNRLNEPLDPDPYAATRRAIVRAAAELAQAHPDHKDGGAVYG